MSDDEGLLLPTTGGGTRRASRRGMRSVLCLLAAACATTTTAMPKGGPRGLRASDHLDIAAQEDMLAKRSSWPAHTMLGYPGDGGAPLVMPWYRSWDTAAEHEALAETHRGEAAALEADYEAACAGRAAEDSPLVRYGIGGWPTKTGMVVYLSPSAGTADAVVASLRCHRAWMMLAPAGMDDCPLDLPGLHVDARGDDHGITLVLSVSEPELVDELQRRTAHDLER